MITEGSVVLHQIKQTSNTVSSSEYIFTSAAVNMKYTAFCIYCVNGRLICFRYFIGYFIIHIKISSIPSAFIFYSTLTDWFDLTQHFDGTFAMEAAHI